MFKTLKSLKKFTTANEYLAYHGFTHINDYQLIIKPAGYDYGDLEFSYHTFPLYEAVKYNPDLNLIELLLKAGANPNFQTKKTLGTVLQTILINDNHWNEHTISLLALLIKYKTNVNSRDKYDGSCPLHQIAFSWTSSYTEEIIELLIANGAKINAKNYKWKTPYDNVLSSHEWYHRKHLPLPEKILNLLNPKSINIYDRE